MQKFHVATSISACVLTLVCQPVLALDARSAALGGSAIAHGQGVHGTLENPSTLMRLQRNQETFHIHLGATVDVQDDGRVIETASDEEDLPDQLEAELDALTGSTLSCDITSAPDTVCLTGTQTLGDLSSRVLDLLERVDGEPLDARARMDLGLAYTATTIPFALHYNFSIAGAGQTDVADSDLDYIQTFADVLADGELTAQELATSVPLNIGADGQTLEVLQPEDVLDSDVSASGIARSQFGFSLATNVNVAGFNVDVGVTPKFSKLEAASLVTKLADRFDNASDSLRDQYNDNEVLGSTFTFDVGATVSLEKFPLRLSAVARNLLKEEVTTDEGFTFETTPQLIVGGAFSIGLATITGDVALNKASQDNFETQVVAAGVEVGGKLLAVRAGLSHDTARTADATALSLGVTLGPLHIGGRLTGAEAAQAGAQLSYSF